MTNSIIQRSLYAVLFIGSSLISCQDDQTEKNAGSIIQLDPVVESYTPNENYEGETILIHGDNFGTNPDDIEVYFYDDVEAVVNSSSKTTISVVVPSGAYVGPITVKVKEKESAGPDFSVVRLCMIGGNLATCPRIKPV